MPNTQVKRAAGWLYCVPITDYLERIMLKNPAEKYAPFKGVALSDRTWPNRSISKPPIWMSTDLRDGNQALMDPMSVNTKLRF